MRFIKISIIITTLVLSIGFISLDANISRAATAPQPSKQSISQIKSNFNNLNISNEIQNKLLAKVKNGKIIDAMNPQKLKKVSDKITPTLDDPYKIYTFADGSKIESGITILDKETAKPDESTNLIQPLAGSVDVSHQSSGSGYTNITAYVWCRNGIFNGSFHAKFTLVNGGYDYITSVYDDAATTVGFTWEKTSFGINKKKENSEGRAKASLRGQLYLGGTGVYSTTAYLNLYVGKNGYSSTNGY